MVNAKDNKLILIPVPNCFFIKFPPKAKDLYGFIKHRPLGVLRAIWLYLQNVFKIAISLLQYERIEFFQSVEPNPSRSIFGSKKYATENRIF